MRVRLDICWASPCSGTLEDLRQRDQLIASSTGLAFQGGPILYAPFRAQTFANIKNTAGFAQSGVLTSAGSSQLRGAGSGAAEAFKNGAEQVGAIVEGSQKADTKAILARAEEAKAKKALADAQSSLLPNPNSADLATIAALQTDATLATAEKAKIDAEAALAAARRVSPE